MAGKREGKYKKHDLNFFLSLRSSEPLGLSCGKVSQRDGNKDTVRKRTSSTVENQSIGFLEPLFPSNTKGFDINMWFSEPMPVLGESAICSASLSG